MSRCFHNYCPWVRSIPTTISQDIQRLFPRQVRDECGTIATDEDNAEMERRVSTVNLNAKRQTGNSTEEYDFGIYFNVVASNMTLAGGWVPYVHVLLTLWKAFIVIVSNRQKQIDDQITLINSKYVGTGIRFHPLGVTRIISKYWHETVTQNLCVFHCSFLFATSPLTSPVRKHETCTDSFTKVAPSTSMSTPWASTQIISTATPHSLQAIAPTPQ